MKKGVYISLGFVLIFVIIFILGRKKITLNGVLNDKIKDFFEKSITDNQYKGRLNIGYVNDKLSRKIKQATGYNLKGLEINIFAKEIRHILNSHPETKLNDFEQLINILENPQIVLKTYEKNGNERVKIINQFDVSHIVIVELHIKKDYISIVTIFKNE